MRIPVRIASINQETPTVKYLTLDLQGHDLSFLPGQWIDCYASIDGRMEVAGYSMTSSPLVRGAIDLAVKLVGHNPVTRFLHEQAREGDVLYIEGGQGDFYYQRNMGGPVVLIAAGIGITPLLSIIRYIDQAAPEVQTTLLYSATTPSELLRRDELAAMAELNPNIRCLFTVTRPSDEPWSGRIGRIDEAMLRDAHVDTSALYYLCGPPPMTASITDALLALGVPRYHTQYEQW